ncbi:hypothetical protein ES708_22812 [subsurface metagenome]
MAEQTVERQPGESKDVSFEVVPQEARNYLVEVNGLISTFTAIAPPPEFVVSNLRISPTSGTLGETLHIIFDITNVGAPGRSFVQLTVERPSYTGSVKRYFTLDAGETATWTENYTLTEVGTYIATVNGLSATFTCTKAPPAEFVISNVSISPSSGLLGEEATLSFKITNTGGERGDWIVTLTFDVVGGEIAWRDWLERGTLDPGLSETRDVPLVFREAGTWTIRVNDHVVTYIAT